MDKKLGRYTLRKELGRGGMATVYLAHDPRFERDVAIKVLPSQFLHDKQFYSRFEREAKAIARVEHPAIVPVYDFGEDQGSPYLVMRHMSGGNLKEKLEAGPMPLAKAVSIISRMASALDEAHRHGMIHRDVKPGNILFDQRGVSYLADFGIVKLAESTTVLTGAMVIGTPEYMSPEQARGDKIDGRSDVYTLGVILFLILTGKPPFEADTPMGLAYKHVHEPVPRISALRSDLPPGCQAIIDKVLAKMPDHRYPTAGEFSAAFKSIVKGGEEPARLPAGAVPAGVHPLQPQSTVPLTTVEPPTFVRDSIDDKTEIMPSSPVAQPQPHVGATRPAAAPSGFFGEIPRSILILGGGLALLAIIVLASLFFSGAFEPDSPMVNVRDKGRNDESEVLAEVEATLTHEIEPGGEEAVPPLDTPALLPTLSSEATPTPMATATLDVPLGSPGRPVQILLGLFGDSPSFIARGDKLAEVLAEATGLNFEVQVFADYRDTIDELCAARDNAITFLPNQEYVIAGTRCGVEVAATAIRFGAWWGASQFVVRVDSGIESLGDLQGKVWGIPDFGSSSYTYPLSMMVELGITPGEIVQSGGHIQAMQAVYDREVDFATAYFSPPLMPHNEQWTYGLDDPEIWRQAGVSPVRDDAGNVLVHGWPDEGGYRLLDARLGASQIAPDIFDATRILALTPQIPYDALVLSSGIPASITTEIVSVLVDYIGTDSCIEESICEWYGWSGFKLVTDSYYDPVRDAIDNLGLTETDILGD